MIYRLLQNFAPEDYCLISTERSDGDGQNFTERLPGEYYYLPPPFWLRRGNRFGLDRLRERANILIAVRQHARRIAAIVKRERCEAVVACTGEAALLPAGHLAARRAGVPFYAYLFDHYSYREWNDPAAAFWARRFEPRLMKDAAAVIVPNEILRDDLRERFGVKAVVIHNSLDIRPYETDAPTNGASEDEARIVYTGAIYEAHYDAFHNLTHALKLLGRSDAKLHLYTNHPAAAFEEGDLSCFVVRHPHLAASEMPRIQMNADVLFLPLAFNSPYPDLVRTSATTKLGEYLAARRPVLVHAPKDSFISWYFRKHECGVVVDENDPKLLAQAIERILSDAELRKSLSEKAWQRARADFSIEASRATFARLLKLDEGGGA